ncbi:unnamed protein product [Rhizopus microsporus]
MDTSLYDLFVDVLWRNLQTGKVAISSTFSPFAKSSWSGWQWQIKSKLLTRSEKLFALTRQPTNLRTSLTMELSIANSWFDETTKKNMFE